MGDNGMSDPTKVYCDNDELLRHILSVHPSREGLFPHELGMLLYISWGTTTTQSQKWPGVWKYTYHVDSPQKLLLSLIERGFIKECSNEELIHCIKMKDIQRILTERGIKPGSNKEKAAILLKQAVTGKELFDSLGFRYYVLTEAGKHAVLSNLGENAQEYPGWNPAINTNIPKVLAKQVNILGQTSYESGGYDLYIDSSPINSRLYLMNTSSTIQQRRVMFFDKPARLRISLDNELVFDREEIDTYQILEVPKLLLVGKKNECKTIKCRAFSLEKWLLVAEETINYEIYLNGPTYEMQLCVNRLNQSDKNLTDGSRVRIAFSMHDVLADEIINKYVAKKAKVTKIPPLVPGDKTDNYIVAIDKNDVELQKLIYYMAFCHMIEDPEIMGAPINLILRSMAFHSEKKIEEAIIKQHTQYNPNVVIATQFVRYNISPNFEDVISALSEHYPDRAMGSDPFGHWNSIGLPSYFKEISKQKENFDKWFNGLVLELKRDGIIDIQWISEFSLYKLVLSYYADTEYQKHFDWLGLQTLDIYIPQLKTGIEYQGEQHYSPVGRFGGEEGYKETASRDERKRKLCKDNGVSLIEWPYNIDINPENLKMMLKKK